MDKTYCDFMDEISSEELYEGLLGYGLFADKLPPVFASKAFFEYCKANTPIFSDKDWHDYVTYSSMRNVNIPRTIGIPTPMKYQRLCVVLRDNWKEIRQHFHAQTEGDAYRVSRIHLRKIHGKKELFEMNYKDWRTDGNPETDLLFQRKRQDESEYMSKYLVKADISTCFPSIYSHSVPWALVGKEEAKETCTDDTCWYNKIDSACSTLKNGETHGLLIGPHSSNLLAEIILTKVDRRLYDEGYRYFRNIDDYDCYTGTLEEAQRFLRDLEDALREYDLPLNYKKTEILELPVANSEHWIHKLNGMRLVATFGKTSYTEVNAYIDTALKLSLEHNDSAVLKYAIKALSGQDMTENAKKIGAKRVMHLAGLYPYLLQLMEEYVFTPFSVDVEHIKDFADSIYREAVVVNNYEAICFAIYFSLRYGFKLKALDIEWVIERSDCILLLMTWLYYLRENHNNPRASELRPLKEEAKRLRDKDMDRYWLFCYETLTEGNLAGEWKALKKANVSFIRNDIKACISGEQP